MLWAVSGAAQAASNPKAIALRIKCQLQGVDGTPENARRACDQSLKRLGVDQIDLYYLHRVDPQVRPTDQAWSRKILTMLPGAAYAPIVGVDTPVSDPKVKQSVHADTGGCGVRLRAPVDLPGVAPGFRSSRVRLRRAIFCLRARL